MTRACQNEKFKELGKTRAAKLTIERKNANRTPIQLIHPEYTLLNIFHVVFL